LDYEERHITGTNEAVGTSFVPISRGGIYQTPTTATALEILSSDANDTAAGSGARTVTIVGLNSSWAEVSQTVSMNGTTAVAVPTSLLRVSRVFVATSGTYATQSAPSHVGTLTLRVSGGGATWAIVYATDFPRGSSQIGAYTVPSGKTALIFPHYIAVEANKPAFTVFFHRCNADTVAAPYSAMLAAEELGGIEGIVNIADFNTPRGPFVGPCDVGYLTRLTTGTGEVSINFEMIVYDTI
jgi:hypothetical protein